MNEALLDVLTVFFLSMLPITELRGSIPYGIGILHMEPIPALIWGVLGNCIPVLFIMKLLDLKVAQPKLGINCLSSAPAEPDASRSRRALAGLAELRLGLVIKWIFRNFQSKVAPFGRINCLAELRLGLLEHYFKKYFEVLHAKHSASFNKWGAFFLALFVAVPLPGTGAWTGALLAYLFNIPYWLAVGSISLGVLGAGIIVTFFSESIKWLF